MMERSAMPCAAHATAPSAKFSNYSRLLMKRKSGEFDTFIRKKSKLKKKSNIMTFQCDVMQSLLCRFVTVNHAGGKRTFVIERPV